MDLKSRKRLLAWTVGVHDHANEETGKVDRNGDNPDALISSHLVNLARIVMNHRKVKLGTLSDQVDKEPIGPVEKEMVGTGGIESDLTS